ncbi:hypothetical protein TELCIR_15856 [Teladorsagia circumcincta]|uniref:Uncharacterized protein n=1 Tax=Teladorsagia circumcincta TaxID=45464 RepID=A0A2G9TYR1_TELCI|nr:hypothetical protein TELCIR_15856 [Teladorsagia circumcincta]
MSHELLAAGAAVGVACTFSTPIGAGRAASHQYHTPPTRAFRIRSAEKARRQPSGGYHFEY